MVNVESISISPGTPYPFGANSDEKGINFAVAARDAQKVALCLYDENNQSTPMIEIELEPGVHKTGNVWHARVEGLTTSLLYGYRVFPLPPDETSYLLLDPYAKLTSTTSVWGDIHSPYQPLGKVVAKSTFDWQGDKFPDIPSPNMIIYEMHVRGFTKDRSSNVRHPGSFLGIVEKIPYLKELGVNAVELLPIHAFNETEAMQVNPKTKERLFNYFGYSSVNFFCPMNRFASKTSGDQAILEFKTMVRELHKNGIEVILDVVYNHTFEGNGEGPTLSYKGFDKQGYYMINPEGHYLDFSGCGNTFNANHPLARELILESLRYWVIEMHVDGFRFDLASILTRAEDGNPLPNAPIVEAISLDPILSQRKLISEAWDAGGLYQVGGFYPGTRWSEWNGRYRDVVRRFIKGNAGEKTHFATALCGSQDLYGWRGSPACSVNFITSHDGFTLADLVTYNEKHNQNNGENNRDGFNHNDSWNCGIEGHSSNKRIVFLRERQIRNFHLALMLSQGIPMVSMGDEYAHTKHGNNNTWCQDNELNWFLWNRLDIRPGFYRYFRSLIHLRKNTPLLNRNSFLSNEDITWHGTMPYEPEWELDNNLIAFSLNHQGSPQLYAAFNASHLMQSVTIPPAGKGKEWRLIVNTYSSPPEDFFGEEQRQKAPSKHFRMPSYSAILLVLCQT